MKNLRTAVMLLMLIINVGYVSGCATTGQDSYVSVSDTSRLEQKQEDPTDDMNWAEKTGCYLLWFALSVPYALAGGNP